jgi:hypothetical protein
LRDFFKLLHLSFERFRLIFSAKKKRLSIIHLLMLFVLLAPVSAAGEQGTEQNCLSFSELSLSRLTLGDNESKVRKLHGKPLKVIKEVGEDADGQYIVSTLHYDDLNVDIVRGSISRLFTNSSGTSTPSGLHPGMTFDEVHEILRTVMGENANAPKKIVVLAVCPAEGGESPGKMKLVFHPSGRLISIEIVRNR